MRKSVLVSGSIVYDGISTLTSTIRETISITDGKLGKQNLMFLALSHNRNFGGTAGNISYGLSKLKADNTLFSLAGNADFKVYEDRLKTLSIKSRIHLLKGLTASFDAYTDKNGEQIGVFKPNVYKDIAKLGIKNSFSKEDLSKFRIAIFSPGNKESITKQISEIKKLDKEIFTIFDPGQMLFIDFDVESLKICFQSSDGVILNDTEYESLKTKFGFSLENVFSFGVKWLIVTKGGEGSDLYAIDSDKISRHEVAAVKITKIKDSTGAGDAYRAGLISGILNNRSLLYSMKIGAKMGAKCVSSMKAQDY